MIDKEKKGKIARLEEEIETLKKFIDENSGEDKIETYNEDKDIEEVKSRNEDNIKDKGILKKEDKVLSNKDSNLDKIKKKFKIPFSFKNMCKKASKTQDQVPVMYLTQKQQVEFKVCRIVSGDIVVINNKAHTLDPQDVWIHKRFVFYIIREIDRRPVSNRDYESVKARGDDTEADVPLIKAVLGATNKPTNPLKDKNIILWIILAIVAVGAFMIFKGGA
jgi:hypothetical protein